MPGLSGSGSRVEALALAPGGTLYVGGVFRDAAGLPLANVAMWNGADWAPLGGGLDGWVRALKLDGDDALWAAMTSDRTGSVHRWDGAAWIEEAIANGPVHDLAIVGRSIVVVGDFTKIGGIAAGGIAQRDAAGWHPIGAADVTGSITAVAADPDIGGFCVAGVLEAVDGLAVDNAACWNGRRWSRLGAGLPGGVAVLARSPGGTWYAGGTLTFTIDPETGAYEAGIARLDGATWHALDGGIDHGFINEVRAIAFSGDDVLIGGCFETAGEADVPARFLARWSPASGWAELAGGLASDLGVFLPSVVGANDIAVDPDGALWIGGLFTRSGGVPAVNVARVPAGSAPVPLVGPRPVLGIGGMVDALAAFDGTVIAAGSLQFAGATRTTGPIRLGGAGWTALGSGLEGIARDLLVRADGSIAVAGELVLGGEAVAMAVLRDGAWSLPGGPVHGTGFTLVEYGGALWLGGDLGDADGVALHNLARLEDASWQAAGAFDGRVSTLVVHDGAIVAGGLFSTVDGAPIAAIARHDGTAWRDVGDGLDGAGSYVNALASSPALGLIVGGSFPGAGGLAQPGLIRWDGAMWRDVGGGLDGGFISALRVHGDGLFATGGFDRAGGAPAHAIAWFDGRAWHALDAGLDDLAESMVVLGDALYVGGPFTLAGRRASSGFAVWTFGQ